MSNKKHKSNEKIDLENSFKASIQTELNRAVGLDYNNHVDIDIKNIDELNKKAQFAVSKQLEELSSIFAAKEKVVEIENKIKKEFENTFSTPSPLKKFDSGFSEEVLNSIRHGRISETYNEELDYKRRTYVLLNENLNEFNYSKKVIKNILQDDFFTQPSNDYIAPKNTIESLIEYVNQHMDKNEQIYKIVPAQISYETTNVTNGESGNSLVNVEGIVFKDKQGDDIFVFRDSYQDYYDSKNNGIKSISVGDERLVSLNLNDAKYRSVELDNAEKILDDKIMTFPITMTNNLLPIAEEKNKAVESVLNSRLETIKHENQVQKEQAKLARVLAYNDITIKDGDNLQNLSGVQFKDAKVGSYYSDRSDIEYSFLIEVSTNNKKTLYEIAIPKDAIRPHAYDKKDGEIGEENHINVYAPSDVAKGVEPKNGVPVIFDSEGKEVSYFLEKGKKQEALSKIVSTFEEISLYNSYQYDEKDKNSMVASNNKPLSVEENKIGVLNELNSVLSRKMRDEPETLELFIKTFKNTGSNKLKI